MARIFISYRREDSDIWVARLVDELRKNFPSDQVFQDIASIDPGADFTEVLDRALGTADVVLAVIGPRWASVTDKQGRRRLDTPTDFVRQEIAESLRRPSVRVFPLLVNGAEMPTEDDLPDPLKPLARRQGFELTVRHWQPDVAQLVGKLKSVPAFAHPPPTAFELSSHPSQSARPQVESDAEASREHAQASEATARNAAASIYAAQASAAAVRVEDLAEIGGLNPLLAAANPLLDLAALLRSTPAIGDLERLRETLVHEIRHFESNARSKGVRGKIVIAARYCLCTFLDEVIGAIPQPGGAAGAWASKGLLITFHNDACGGEEFFALLKRASEDAVNNIDLLELMYMCLAFGFEGKYQGLDGRSQLEELRESLYVTIRAERGELESELSTRWQPAEPTKVLLTNRVPRWAVAVAILLSAYVGLSWSLSRTSASVAAVLQEIPDKFAPAQLDVHPNR